MGAPRFQTRRTLKGVKGMQDQRCACGCLGNLLGWLIGLLIVGLLLYWADSDVRRIVHEFKTQPHKTRKIGEVLENFTYYAGETVTIEGVVSPGVLKNLYFVSDDSADIMVISDYTSPAEGAIVRVTGRVTRNRLGDPVIDEERCIVVREPNNPSPDTEREQGW